MAEHLFADLRGLITRLSALEPEAVWLNLALTAATVAAAAAVVLLLRRLLGAGLNRLAARGLIHAEDAEGKPRVARVTWVVVRLLVLGAAVAAVLAIWGVDTLGWLTEGSGAVVARIALVVLAAVAAIEIVGRLLDRMLHRGVATARDARRAQQIRTMTPLIRGVAIGFILVVAALTLLSQIGVAIGPLLASAGVVGLAVGFGAQTLVKDFLTGLFLVVEDIVAIGDNVRIGDSAGAVEAMTLRTIRLRNIDGTLHVFPYSEAQVIHNRTKAFSSYVFNIGVSYDTDLDRALAVMARVGGELQADPDYADKIIQPLEVFGVDQLGDSAVVLKARFKTLPQEQWRVGRAYNKRIKQAFDAEGIEIPFPMRKLVIDRGEAAADAQA